MRGRVRPAVAVGRASARAESLRADGCDPRMGTVLSRGVRDEDEKNPARGGAGLVGSVRVSAMTCLGGKRERLLGLWSGSFSLQHKSADDRCGGDGGKCCGCPIVTLYTDEHGPGDTGQADDQPGYLAHDVAAKHRTALVFTDFKLAPLRGYVRFLRQPFKLATVMRLLLGKLDQSLRGARN